VVSWLFYRRGPSFFRLSTFTSALLMCSHKNKDTPFASSSAAANRRALFIAFCRRTSHRVPPPHHPSPSPDLLPLPQFAAPGPPLEPPPMPRPQLLSVVAGRHTPPFNRPVATAPTCCHCPPPPEPSPAPSTSPAQWVAAAMGSLVFSPIARLELAPSPSLSQWYANLILPAPESPIH
jgi:hypothetical protein